MQVFRKVVNRSYVSARCISSSIEEFAHSANLTPKTSAQPVITSSTLSNGMKIITSDSSSAVCSVKISVLSGSRAEKLSEKGAAQMLSTTAFSGTGKRSGLRLVRDLENLGATLNSSADREKITYEISVLKENVEAAVSCLAEAVTSPPKATYVISESKETASIAYTAHNKSIHSQLSELMHEAAFGENSPLGQSFFANSLDSLAASDVLAYRAANYTTGNIVATASGIPHATFKAMMECNLHDLPVQPSSVPASPYIGGDIKVRTSTSGPSYLGLGFPIPAGEEQTYNVLFGILSSNLAGKAPKGLLKPFFNYYSTGGIMGFYASGSAMQAAAMLETVVTEIKACQKVASIDGMKTKSSLNNALSLNESSSITSALLHGHSSDFSKVTVATVSAAASAILKANPSYVVLGTTSGTPSIASINKLMK